MRRQTNSARRLGAGLAVTAALLVPLAVFGGPALAKSADSASQYQYSSGSQYQYRIQICHKTGSRKHPAHTIWISSAAWKAHMRHGDHLGPCGTGETPQPKLHGHGSSHQGHDSSHHGQAPTTPPTGTGSNPGQGHGGDNGNGHGDAGGNGHGNAGGNGDAGGNGNGHHGK